MKLVDAMDLGFALVKFRPSVWLMPDGSCGCAFGGAIAAVGRQREFCEQLSICASYSQVSELQVVRELWPWLTGDHIQHISELAWALKKNLCTREQLLDYVRSIEPAELPDISLEEQHRLEDLDAEREGLSDALDPAYERNGR